VADSAAFGQGRLTEHPARAFHAPKQCMTSIDLLIKMRLFQLSSL
jgi:hypothetical protein